MVPVLAWAVAVAAGLLLGLAVLGLGLQARRLREVCSAGSPIPRPFPWYSDIIWHVWATGGLPDSVKLHRRYGPLYWWRFLGLTKVQVGGYEAARKLLHGEHTIVESDVAPSVKALVGPWGLTNIHGTQHLRIKRLAQAAFTPRAVRGYLPRMQATVEEAIGSWAAQGDIRVYEEVKRLTFRVAVEMIVGFDGSWTSGEGFADVNRMFQEWREGLFSFPLALPWTSFGRAMKARAGLMDKIEASLDLLQARRAAEASEGATDGAGQPEQPTALDLLLASRDEEGKGLSRAQLCDLVLTLLFAGHDTSATTLARMFHHLHRHPEVAERLREEQAAVIAQRGPAITEESLADMPWADAVVRETLRATPVITGLPRMALQARCCRRMMAMRDFELCGYRISRGTRLTGNLSEILLTDPRFRADDPMQFKPQRWLAIGGPAAKQGAWVPFGGGHRLCLGWLLAMAEMKVVVACASRGYRMELQEDSEPWKLFPLAVPMHGMPARFTATPAAPAS